MANVGGEFNKLVTLPTSTCKVHVEASSEDSGSEELYKNPVLLQYERQNQEIHISCVIQVAASSVC